MNNPTYVTDSKGNKAKVEGSEEVIVRIEELLLADGFTYNEALGAWVKE